MKIVQVSISVSFAMFASLFSKNVCQVHLHQRLHEEDYVALAVCQTADVSTADFAFRRGADYASLYGWRLAREQKSYTSI